MYPRAGLLSIDMIYDISPPISERLQVWPQDTPPSRQVLCDMKRGANITLSTLHGTVHLGAHADAPSHYGRDAPDIYQRALDYYLGPCQVVRVAAGRGKSVGPADLPGPINAKRVLIATGTYPDCDRFNEDFGWLDPTLVEFLHQKQVRLVGIDTPSVDAFSSKNLPAHQMFLKHDMAILEGLVLRDVPEGLYELIALPLPLQGFDASPVRAVLRTFA
jgi:arylformamidase